MVTVIKCSGHKFAAIENKQFGVTSHWKCTGCGLVVHTLEAANFLEGKLS